MLSTSHPRSAPVLQEESPSYSDFRNWGTQERWVPPALGTRRVSDAFERLQFHLGSDTAPVYGIHTGFGADVSARASADWRLHQHDLLTYLTVGVGDALPQTVVRRALRLQAHKTQLGYSGVHPETFRRLVALSNQPVLPRVPCFGSLGASGDLIPMAHAVAPLFPDQSQVNGPRDVLSLVNTNSMMASFGIELLELIRQVVDRAIDQIARASIALGYQEKHFAPQGINLPGQCDFVMEAGARLTGSIRRLRQEATLARLEAPREEQARYSIRCAPFVIGGALWSLAQAQERLETEARRIADNPVILDHEIWHGGHFYALPIAQAADLMADALYRTCELLDREVLLLMSPETNNDLPRNLEVPGFSHVKGMHQLISSLLQSLRTHQLPSRLLSFSCEGNNQDVVPCGMAALVSLQDQLRVGTKLVGAAEFVMKRALAIYSEEPLTDEHKLSRWTEH